MTERKQVITSPCRTKAECTRTTVSIHLKPSEFAELIDEKREPNAETDAVEISEAFCSCTNVNRPNSAINLRHKSRVGSSPSEIFIEDTSWGKSWSKYGEAAGEAAIQPGH